MIDLPNAYTEDIKLEKPENLYLKLPTFLSDIEEVEEDKKPLEFSLEMKDGSPVPDCVHLK